MTRLDKITAKQLNISRTQAKAMIKNDGSKANVDVFWERFSEFSGKSTAIFKPVTDDFYSREFNNAKESTKENPLVREAICAAHKENRKVVLATNPIFPLNGQITRLGWIGLEPEDFDLITSYESDSFCKPNPKYFTSICERIGVSPEECLMIGNDENEDMHAASAAGLNCYLVTDCIIKSNTPWKGDHGSFAEMVEMLKTI